MRGFNNPCLLSRGLAVSQQGPDCRSIQSYSIPRRFTFSKKEFKGFQKRRLYSRPCEHITETMTGTVSTRAKLVRAVTTASRTRRIGNERSRSSTR